MQIFKKIDSSDPSAEETRNIITQILIVCNEDTKSSAHILGKAITQYKSPIISTAALVLLSYLYWYTQ